MAASSWNELVLGPAGPEVSNRAVFKCGYGVQGSQVFCRTYGSSLTAVGKSLCYAFHLLQGILESSKAYFVFPQFVCVYSY